MSICVEDVDEHGWPLLLDGLRKNAHNLEILHLEAISEKDPYTSPVGFSSVFSKLPNLQCLRLERTPIGSEIVDSSAPGNPDIILMSVICQNLRTVVIDYCDITMKCFESVWNNCKNLSFLGMAGLQADEEQIRKGLILLPNDNLKILRFVDCQVNDAMVLLIIE